MIVSFTQRSRLRIEDVPCRKKEFIISAFQNNLQTKSKLHIAFCHSRFKKPTLHWVTLYMKETFFSFLRNSLDMVIEVLVTVRKSCHHFKTCCHNDLLRKKLQRFRLWYKKYAFITIFDDSNAASGFNNIFSSTLAFPDFRIFFYQKRNQLFQEKIGFTGFCTKVRVYFLLNFL